MSKLYASARIWRAHNLSSHDGVVIGSDQSQEWMLPWWWMNFQRFNKLPVSFVDFGMSPEMRNWCEARGELIRLRVANIFVSSEEELSPEIARDWRENFGIYCLESRNAWFKKPLACLQSPYRRSIWLDLDCEIRCPLTPLFDLLGSQGLGIAKDQATPIPGLYNSGVLVFQHGLPIFEAWADGAFEQNHLFPGDQDLLSHLIEKEGCPIVELPPHYNWSRLNEPTPEARIVHWHGPPGKMVIQQQLTNAMLEENFRGA
ncbi:MAG: hypothetical protein KGJ02_05770 [Verrucomicrobiota bacterium]|nr:hypothetical protein [Verrucomicrobiota bacterium]